MPFWTKWSETIEFVLHFEFNMILSSGFLIRLFDYTQKGSVILHGGLFSIHIRRLFASEQTHMNAEWSQGQMKRWHWRTPFKNSFFCLSKHMRIMVSFYSVILDQTERRWAMNVHWSHYYITFALLSLFFMRIFLNTDSSDDPRISNYFFF